MSRRDEEFRDFASDRAAALHRTAYLLCGDWHLADDLVQETLLKAYRHWSRVQRADNADAYVRRILVNVANSQWRRHRTGSIRVELDRHEPVVPDAADAVAARVDLMEALLSLPARQRATVVLRFLEGLSERETAAALRCSTGTVKSQTSRALSTLRVLLHREEVSL